jgi:SAM-dependent methyltransferase
LYSGSRSPAQTFFETASHHARSATSILDIGCGHDAPVLLSLPVSAQARVVGVDLVEQFTVPVESRVRLLRADAGRLPFVDHTFDLIISRSVFEHLEQPELVFLEIRRLLAPGGSFILLTPNRWDYVSLAASLIPNRWHPALVGWMTGRDERDTFPTRYRANTVGRLRALARAAGLNVVELKRLREHPHYLQFSAAAYLLGVSYEQTVQRGVPALRPWILGKFQRPGDNPRPEGSAR